MASELVPLPVLTPAQYSDLADVPPELEWLANITNLAPCVLRLSGLHMCVVVGRVRCELCGTR